MKSTVYSNILYLIWGRRNNSTPFFFHRFLKLILMSPNLLTLNGIFRIILLKDNQLWNKQPKIIKTENSLKGLMLKLKLQLWPPDAKSWIIGKDPDAGKDWRQEEEGTIEDEMVGWHHQLNGHELSKLWEILKDREAWHAAVYGITKSWTWLSDWTKTARLVFSSKLMPLLALLISVFINSIILVT